VLRGKRFWTAVATWIQSSSADAAAPRSCGKRPLPLGSTSFRPAPPRADGAASGPGPPGLAARRRRPAEAAQHRAVLTRRPNPPIALTNCGNNSSYFDYFDKFQVVCSIYTMLLQCLTLIRLLYNMLPMSTYSSLRVLDDDAE